MSKPVTQTTPRNLKIAKVFSLAKGGFGWSVEYWDGHFEEGEEANFEDAVSCVSLTGREWELGI